MTDTQTVTPVKGMVWKHAKRVDFYNNKPAEYTVTSINTGTGRVYSKDRAGWLIKTPLRSFPDFVLEVVSVPEPKAKAAEPKTTDAEKAALWARAHEAGMAAGEAALPTPMHVVQRANPLDDNSPIVKAYAPVMDGVCGFAYINVRPGNGAFARWMAKSGLGYKGYYGGRQVSVSAFGQSMERKMAYAAAFSQVLREAGIQSSTESRMD